MDTYAFISTIIIAILMGVLLYGHIQRKPDQFSSDSIQKSLFTLGCLSLVLIAFFACVWMFMQQKSF